MAKVISPSSCLVISNLLLLISSNLREISLLLVEYQIFKSINFVNSNLLYKSIISLLNFGTFISTIERLFP